MLRNSLERNGSDMRNQWKYLFKRGLMLLAGSCCLILLASCGQNGAEGAQSPPEEAKAQFSDTGMTAAGKFFPYDGTLEISLCGAELAHWMDLKNLRKPKIWAYAAMGFLISPAGSW